MTTTKKRVKQDRLAIARAFVTRFQEQALGFLAERGVAVTEARIFAGRSYEEPSWEQSILTLVLPVNAETAFALWDELSGMLNRAIEQEPAELQEILLDATSVDIEWDLNAAV